MLRRKRCEPWGFTLVEVLVTLVLLSMVAAVVFGSLRQVLEARDRLRPYLDHPETTLVSGWFRQTVQASIADYNQGKHRFVGTASAVSGLTASPLVGPAGTPTPFRWVMRYDPTRDLTALEYEESPKQTLQIAAWAGSAKGHSPTMPGADMATGMAAKRFRSGKSIPQLPQLVRLSGRRATCRQ